MSPRSFFIIFLKVPGILVLKDILAALPQLASVFYFSGNPMLLKRPSAHLSLPF